MTSGEVKLFMEANGWGFPGIKQADVFNGGVRQAVFFKR